MKNQCSTLIPIALLIFLFSNITNVSAQPTSSRYNLDISRFEDSAHHWYDINDDERIINPLPGRPQYETNEIIKIAENVILLQKDNGGWAKNYDVRAILSDEQIELLIENKDQNNTTFDNGATHSHLSYLAEVYTITGDERYKAAFMKGLDFIFKAQYSNGGWPQSYPDLSGYHKYITFNDGAMPGVMMLLRAIVSEDPNYLFVDEQTKKRVMGSYWAGLDCIMQCQIIENGIKTAWCQQHDNVTLKPADARIYEKASICSQESAQILDVLMMFENPTTDMIDAIESAVKWFRKVELHGIRMEWVESTEAEFLYHKSSYDRIIVEDEKAPRIWARFYELETQRPIFSGRNGTIVYSMSEIDRDRRTGYGWYTYEPELSLSLYEKWHEKYVRD
ncbi:MAG: pectate lyase [Bacteroidetes bacterium]|nr:pectate lyase [Bacteroidota bacterium]